jgi:hypothetical protein
MKFALEHPAQRNRNGAREAISQRAQHWSARHDRGLGPKGHSLAAGQPGELGPVQSDRPLRSPNTMSCS